MLSQLVAGGIKCIPCDSSGRGPWKLVPAVLWTWHHVPFPFALCIFTVINHSHEYNSMLGPKRPSRESSNPGVLGIANIGPFVPNSTSFTKEKIYQHF